MDFCHFRWPHFPGKSVFCHHLSLYLLLIVCVFVQKMQCRPTETSNVESQFSREKGIFQWAADEVSFEKGDSKSAGTGEAILPRCTKTEDNVIENDTKIRRRRRKRFVAHISKWQRTDLSWRFRDPYNLFQNASDLDIARRTFARAFEMWSTASDYALRFQDLSNVEAFSNGTSRADIDIFFALGAHGDHEAFDGRGGIVAHSGYPSEGKIHLDASELWTINGDAGIDLRYVTLHESGHALGLRHSKHKNSIMHPIYKKRSHEIALSDDDINGIRYLYPKTVDLSRVTHRMQAKKTQAVDFEAY